jgi:hypothetical protein
MKKGEPGGQTENRGQAIFRQRREKRSLSQRELGLRGLRAAVQVALAVKYKGYGVDTAPSTRTKNPERDGGRAGSRGLASSAASDLRICCR